jgi:membrane protein DedA with SNARE-associated domain
MRWSRFLPANAAGGIVWAGFYTLVAYLAGNAITHMSGSIDAVIASTAILAVVAAVIVMGRQTNRLALRAEAAYPGPLE